MFNLLPRTFINSTLALLRNASGIFLPRNHEPPATPPPSSAGQNRPPVSGIADHVSRRCIAERLSSNHTPLSGLPGRKLPGGSTPGTVAPRSAYPRLAGAVA